MKNSGSRESEICVLWQTITRYDLNLQLLAVDNATPFALIGRGKISPTSTQEPGPHVVAKKNMKMQINAIMIESAVVECEIVPIMAMTN